MQKYTGLEIAVIGMSGRFPGAANIRAFWNNLKNGIESVSFFTDEELLREGESQTTIDDPSYVKANAFLENKEFFDAAFFSYRPDEARLMDPQVRLFHECVWEALEDAGCNLASEDNRIGLFAGATSNTNWEVYAQLANSEGLVDPFSASHLSNAKFIATRISYLLNLRGPSVYMDSACSTSLVAIHNACRSLLLGDCNIALAGGVSLTNKSRSGYLYKEGMILSRDGHCRTFDAAASGTVGGEGASVVVLKTLKNALKDGDHIWAIVKGSGINNDGNNKVGYTAPSVNGQHEAIMMAQKWAKVPPESISYVEAHGTATRLGDPIEVEALARTFGKSTEKYCALGAVKSNIGHLDAAAGAAGVIKTALSLKHRQLPPSLHFKTPNPDINFEDSPFYVNTELKEWKNEKYPLRAGVSSFGIGGTNAHVIMEEAPEQEPSSAGRSHQLLLLSAKTPAALARNIDNLRAYFRENPELKLADVAYTRTTRTPFAYRKAVVCSNVEEAIESLAANATEAPLAENAKPSVVFMFPGQGSQYVNMCRDLYQQESAFREMADQCFNIANRLSGKDIKAIVFAANATQEIDNTEFTQPVLFIIEYALAQLLMKWGIQPAAMIGHSIGEYVAACISGVFSLEDALSLVIKRGKLMQQLPPGLMLSISITKAQLETLLQAYNDVSLAAANSTEQHVVSGSTEAIERFKADVESRGYVCRSIRTSHAFHSYMMDGILSEFEKELRRVSIKPIQIPFISNLTGKPATDAEISRPKYWSDHLRKTVMFAAGIETLLEKKNSVFVEIGPGKTLSSFVRAHQLRSREHKVVGLVRHPREAGNDLHFLLSALGELWCNGLQPDWTAFYENQSRRKVSLPTYSFDKIKYPVNVDAFKLIGGMMNGSPMNVLQLNGNAEVETGNDVVSSADGAPGKTEKALRLLWQDFFGKVSIDADDDFFDIGGDSLKALTMIGRIRRKFNVEISLTEFFRRPSIRKLSELISADNEIIETANEVFIPQAPVSDHYKLSSAQQRLYFLYQFNSASLAYNMPQVIRLQGQLDEGRLANAFKQLLARHESLRTWFEIANEEPVQKIAAEAALEIEYYYGKEAEAQAVVRQFLRPFNLNYSPLMRVGLLKFSAGDHLLMVDMHHIISDGISHGILIKDFAALYNNEELAAPSLQYKDYAEWQQGSAQQERIAKQKDFWLNEFSGEISTLELPMDFPRPAIKTYEGDVQCFELGFEETNMLRSVATNESATLYMVMLSVFNILLSKLSGQDDVVVGSPASGRQNAELENMIGMFVNTIALRNQPRGELSFREFLTTVRSKTLACFDNQAYQYEDLIDELKVERNTSRNPLFDVLFSYQTMDRSSLELPGLALKQYNAQYGVSQFDLTLWVVESPEKLLLKFEYATALFKKETIEKFIAYFRNILAAVTADINEKIAAIEIVSAEEKHRLITGFNDTAFSYPLNETIVSIFEETVRLQQTHTAVSFNGSSLSYNELNEKSNSLARKIRRAGVQEEDVIGILLQRSHEMIVSMLAVLKTGCAYLPIDPDYPVDRIRYVMNDSNMKIVLTEPSLVDICGQIDLIDVTANDIITEENGNLDCNVSSSNLAYIIYTSGSTGNPKGVMIEHKSVINFLHGVSNRIDFNKDNTILCLTTISFDIFVLETIVPLLKGMKVVIAAAEDQRDATALATLIRKQRVSMLQLTPSHLKLLLASEEAATILDNIRVVMVGGEAFPVELLNELKNIYEGRIYNMYGPTETTVWSTIRELTFADSINIGKPISNTTIRIINDHGNFQPAGIAGELCIGGHGLARGYWNNKKLTAERFITDPADANALVYRTGDLARWLPDGNIEYLGRIDNQVKIRGFRIELGEIESRLIAHSQISEAVVIAKEKDGDKYLVAYYVSAEEMTINALRAHLAATLPAYMLPSYYVHLLQLPLTPNGKLNRKALPDPGFTGQEYVAASNEIEEKLVQIWSEVLKMEPGVISVTSNFFELGGHSLKASVVVNKMNKHFGIEVPLQEMFNKQNIESLADYLITIKQLQSAEAYDKDIIEIVL